MSGPRKRTKPPGPLPGLGEAATARRHRLGMTQRDMAELAGVGLSSVHALESGRDTLTLALALKMLNVLGLTLAAGTRRALEQRPEVRPVEDAGQHQ